MKELKPPFEVVCIDDKRRPQEIPQELWVKEGEKYNVKKVIRTMDNQLGFVLEEIELGEDTFPYDAFSPVRFGLTTNYKDEEEKEAEEAVKDLIKETTAELDWEKITQQDRDRLDELSYEEQKALEEYERKMNE